LMACSEAKPHTEADTDVSSAIAKTMAAIVGRAQRRISPAKPQKLGLSKVKSQVTHRTKAKEVELLKKADTPTQLAGYLGWSSAAKKQAAFSKQWGTTGERAAQNLNMHDLEAGHQAATSKHSPKRQALVADKIVSTPFSRLLAQQEASMSDESEEKFPAMEWGKGKQGAKMALEASKTSTVKTNGYLDAVGWSAPEVVKAEDNYYLRTLKKEDPKKKFLAAVEAASTETHESAPKNKYSDIFDSVS